MRKAMVVVLTGVCMWLVVGLGWQSAQSFAAEGEAPSRLCVVWTSGDPGVAKNVCFMYTHNAKRRGWFDVVHLVVWGPSAKLLAENKDLQNEVKTMQKSGVVVEACVACEELRRRGRPEKARHRCEGDGPASYRTAERPMEGADVLRPAIL